jgi:PAS domain S-box-containing protein
MPDHRTAPSSTLTDLLFGKGGVGLCLVAPDGTVIRANAEWLRSTRFTEERVVGENIIDLFPETRDMALALHARARAGHRVEVPRHAQWVNGVETWWEGSIEPVPMEDGMGLLITTREVARLMAGQRPGAWPVPSREILQGIIEGTADLVAALDLEFRYLAFNRAYAEEFSSIFGRSIRVGDSMLEALAQLPRDQANAKESWGRALAGETFTVVQEFGDARRARKRFELRYSPIHDASGIIGASHVVRDVTEMSLVQEALQESEERYRTLFTSMTEGFALGEAICGADGTPLDFRLLQMNDAFERQTGLRRDEIQGRPFREVLPQLEQAWVDTYCRVALSGEPVRFEQYNRDLDRHFSVYCYSPARGRFAVVFTDVTEANRRAEAKARDHELLVAALRAADDDRRRLAAILDVLPAGVAIADASGKILQFNAALTRIWGSPPVPESAAEYREWHGWWVDTGEPLAAHEWAMARVLATGEVVPGDVVEIEKFDGTGRATIINAAAPIRNAAGEIIGGALAEIDISAQKRAEEALVAANERLIEAARRKDEFLGMLSHELRNPLAPLRNASYILRHATSGTEQEGRARAVIERQTEHLTRLVDDLLDVTRISRGKIELRRERVDLRELVWRASDDFRPLMDERGIAFRVALPDVALWVDADPTRIAQVIGNLLQNAAKFTRRGDAVAVDLHTVGDHAEISVRDTGAGIDEALLSSMFEPFVQGERTLARTEGGLGLGLALVKGMAELHGGSVRAESAGRGHGAELVVRLPLVAPAPPRDRAGEHPRHVSNGRRVLVVDDNVDAAESLADLVAMLGHAVETASDGASAIEKARANPPDIVLCDLGLPGMSGYEVAKALRGGGKRLRLFAVSGYAQPEDVKKALEAGFDAHLAKPLKIEDLERLLAS